MKLWKKYGKVIAMSAAALGMTAALTVESSMAYFTTYVSAGGGGTISLGTSTTITEKVVDMAKRIQIENTSENDCYVRVKIFAGATVTYEQPSGDNWSEGEDGYWNYNLILKGKKSDDETGDMTTELIVKEIGVPEGFDGDDFNIVVIHECVPVVYDDAGNPYADWKVGKEDAD